MNWAPSILLSPYVRRITLFHSAFIKFFDAQEVGKQLETPALKKLFTTYVQHTVHASIITAFKNLEEKHKKRFMQQIALLLAQELTIIFPTTFLSEIKRIECDNRPPPTQ